MKLILKENIEHLGHIGDIVKVAPGYARNYLLPKGLAMEASGRNMRELEHKKRLLAQKKEQIRKEMLSFAEKLTKVTDYSEQTARRFKWPGSGGCSTPLDSAFVLHGQIANQNG